MVDLDGLRRIAEVEFASVVKDTIRMDFEVRVILMDNSFADIFLSEKLCDKFGFHGERMDLAGATYRYDNVPDQRWKNLSTFPFHFHKGSQDKVEDPPFPQSPDSGFRAFMKFVEEQLKATPAQKEPVRGHGRHPKRALTSGRLCISERIHANICEIKG